MTPNRVEKLVFAVLGRVGPPRRLCTLRRKRGGHLVDEVAEIPRKL